jgi:predicted TPR repeat methyltransferase
VTQSKSFLALIDKEYSHCDAYKISVLAVQCNENERFEEPTPHERDVTVVYNMDLCRDIILRHEITHVPAVIISKPNHEQNVISLEGFGVQNDSKLVQSEPTNDEDEKHALFPAAIEAYENFEFSKACYLFSQIVTESGPSVNGAMFNLAGILHMVGYPSLAVYHVSRLLRRSPDDMISHTFLWNITQAAADGAISSENDAHLLECCVRCYTWLCEKNPLDVTSNHRLTTLGRSPNTGNHSIADKKTAAKALNAYARKIYEDMGDVFENRLVDKLGYKGPRILFEMITDVMKTDDNLFPALGKWNILDVGCGSGLVGHAFAPLVNAVAVPDASFDGDMSNVVKATFASSSDSDCFNTEYENISPLFAARKQMEESEASGFMVGVDISSKMCEITAGTKTYSHVACCDAVVALDVFARNIEGISSPLLDMVVVADTFIYLGPLDPSFAASRRALRPGGLLVFSIEDLDQSLMRMPTTNINDESSSIVEEADLEQAVPGWGGELLSSSRYAHTPRYIAALAQCYGFIIKSDKEVVLRKESTIDIIGRMYVLSLIEEK